MRARRPRIGAQSSARRSSARRVLLGGRMAKPAANLASSLLSPSAELTQAERQIVKLALQGLSNQAVAGVRGASVRTVAHQLSAAYRKLRVRCRRELWALYHEPDTIEGLTPAGARALSRRELEVLRFVKAGRSNKIIADSLGIRLSTVSTTLSRARRKLRP